MSILSEFLHQAAPKDGWGTAFVTAGLGAFVGGWVASRSFTKRAVVAELNALSTALALCFSISNKFIALKLQHVASMKQRFHQVKREHEEFMRRPMQARGRFVFQADFQTLSPMLVPIDELKKTVFEKTSIRGRGLVALVDLASSIEGLSEAMESRTELAHEIRNRSNKTDEDVAALYFGIRMQNGHIDERYSTNVDAIYRQTDDCIFFSRILAYELVQYGNSLRRRHMWRYWLGLPKMRDADWSKAQAEGALPDHAEYERWLSGFRALGRWEKIKATFVP
ncbi:hypothetical protein ACSHT2_01645 [Bradyrhizobium sp. PUT101]|uniref:hypothetical protein n=1 Tax=Bradyrhizobium sp. PUT101 TaxID=3447427 RepID=UPI003F86AE9C